MVEPMGFKTNILGNSESAKSKIGDYDAYRKKIDAFSNELFSNAPLPTPVVKVIVNLVEKTNPKFSYPVGKRAALFLAIQHFAYKTFENSIVKNINKFKN